MAGAATDNDISEAEQALFYYIEIHYYRQGKHSTNSYKSSARCELEWWNCRGKLVLKGIILNHLSLLQNEPRVNVLPMTH